MAKRWDNLGQYKGHWCDHCHKLTETPEWIVTPNGYLLHTACHEPWIKAGGSHGKTGPHYDAVQHRTKR